MKTKICSTCKNSLPLLEFQKHILSKDGLQSQCKNCRNKANRKRYYEKKLKIYHESLKSDE